MFEVISYVMKKNDPVWPGNPPVVETEKGSAIADGDDANTTVLKLFSHSGSHIDCPKHFNDSGLKAYQLDIGEFVFYRPRVIPVDKPNAELITKDDLLQYEDKLKDADLLCLYTGWSEVRATDPDRYVGRGPALGPEAADYLLDEHPQIRGIAADLVSIGSQIYPSETKITHQKLMGKGRKDGRYILVIEDVKIDPNLDKAQRVYAWPLRIEESDGSPITVVVEYPE